AVLHVNAGQLDALQQDAAVDHLSGDIRVQSLNDVTAEAIDADQVWAGVAGVLPPLSGQSIGSAVIGSGVGTTHNALRNRVVSSVDFTGGDGMDRYGHGTHVASTIAGLSSSYSGIAWSAALLNLRALGDDGSGQASDVIESMDWAVKHRKQYNI